MPLPNLLRPVAILAALAGLTACAEMDQGGAQGEGLFAIVSTVSRPVGDPLPQAPIAGGDILIKGPPGYCVEGRSLRNRASGGFALLASCHVMTGGKSGAEVAPAVMTVSAQAMAGGVQVPDRRALAQAFAPSQVLAQSSVKGLTMVHLGQGGDTAVPDADPRHWRGAMALNGYLVSLAVYGPKDSAEAGAAGSALLVELAEALRRARPAPTPPATAGTGAVRPQKAAATPSRDGTTEPTTVSGLSQ